MATSSLATGDEVGRCQVPSRRTSSPDQVRTCYEEYMKHARFGHTRFGPPGAGDKFFKHVFDNGFKSSRVRRVRITPTDDDRCGFEELPVNSLDRADRKFLATAVVGNAPILNAADSDWDEQKELTTEVGVEVRQLCPQHASKAR